MGTICQSSVGVLVIRKTIVPCCSGSCFSITNGLNYFVDFQGATISADKINIKTYMDVSGNLVLII